MRLRFIGRTETRLSPVFGLVMLSGLWAISSLSSDLLPLASGDALSPVQRQAMLFLVFSTLAASIAFARQLDFPRGRRALACACLGLGLFVVPSALVSFAQARISTFDRVVVFSLTPVFAVVLQPYLQGGDPGRGKAALAGSICAFAGILFLFPFNVYESFHAVTGLCALFVAALVIAATNCIAVKFARTFANDSILPMAAQAGAASTICFALASLITPDGAWHGSVLTPELLPSFAIDLLALFLLFWLMRHLAASRMTAAFLIAPLFTILAAAALQPISPSERAWLGMFLLAGGAGWLVFAPPEQGGGNQLVSLHAPFADSPRRPPQG